MPAPAAWSSSAITYTTAIAAPRSWAINEETAVESRIYKGLDHGLEFIREGNILGMSDKGEIFLWHEDYTQNEIRGKSEECCSCHSGGQDTGERKEGPTALSLRS